RPGQQRGEDRPAVQVDAEALVGRVDEGLQFLGGKALSNAARPTWNTATAVHAGAHRCSRRWARTRAGAADGSPEAHSLRMTSRSIRAASSTGPGALSCTPFRLRHANAS